MLAWPMAEPPERLWGSCNTNVATVGTTQLPLNTRFLFASVYRYLTIYLFITTAKTLLLKVNENNSISTPRALEWVIFGHTHTYYMAALLFAFFCLSAFSLTLLGLLSIFSYGAFECGCVFRRREAFNSFVHVLASLPLASSACLRQLRRRKYHTHRQG